MKLWYQVRKGREKGKSLRPPEGTIIGYDDSENGSSISRKTGKKRLCLF